MKSTFWQLDFVPILKSRLLAENSLIQVVLGPRQVGKTTGVLQCLKTIKKPHLYVTADEVLSPTPLWLEEQWQKAFDLDPSGILVVDEIQKIPEWTSVLKKLWDRQKRSSDSRLKVVVLGSSSLQIQKGLSESLTGRFETIYRLQWNYHESRQISKMTLDEFLQYGGYPGSYDFIADHQRWAQFMRHSIIETVVEKDILRDARIRNPSLFKQAYEILCQYPAQEVSYNKLLGQLQDKGNTDLIKSYIQMYAGAFLIFALEKYSPKTLKRKTSTPKILPLCPALVNFNREENLSDDELGRLFELAVGAVLLQLPGQLYYWREGTDEVDYVFKTIKGLYAIEVKSGKKRIQKGLNSFCKKNKKAIPLFITRDNFLDLCENKIEFFENR